MNEAELAAFEAVTGPGGSDARWFTGHPGASEFYRMITDAEVAWLKENGAPQARKGWRVKVSKIPGARTREFLLPPGEKPQMPRSEVPCWTCGHTMDGHYRPDPSLRHRVLRCRFCPRDECQRPT